MAGTVGTSFTGDIAIDDMIVKDGGCGMPSDCNFEKDMCLWRNVKTKDNFDWLKGKGSTSSSFTGPSVDHTLNSDQGIVTLVIF